MPRRGRIISLAVLVLALVWPGRDTPAQVRPPNVLVIVADDMGYGDVGVYGTLMRSPRRASVSPMRT
jgi:hypothetical protein